MKNYKKLIGLFLGLGITCSNINANGLNMQNIFLQTKGVISTHHSTNKITDKIDKREEIHAEEYAFGGNLSNNDNKYIKVYKDVAYLDSNTKKIIALSDTKTTFRYNPKMQLAKCLGSFSRSVILNPSYSISVSSRNANKTTYKGSGLINLEFKSSLGKVLDKTTLEVDCDYKGHVTSGNIELN